MEYGEFLDERDNKVYRTVQIGKQTWMAQNLNFVPEDGSVTRCAPDDDDCSVYGRYYDYRNKPKDNHLCPTGWDVPSDDQIDELNGLKCQNET